MKRVLATLLAAAVFWGCTADHFRQSADLQVDQILRDRKEQTLAYQPQVVVSTAPATRPSKHAYAKIPVTPIAPPTTAPIAIDEVKLEYGPLGPESRWKDAPGVVAETLKNQLTLRRGADLPPMGPPAPGDPTHHLDFFGCIEYAVKHSREYQTEMETLYLAALRVTLERHLFSPRPFARVGLSAEGREIDARENDDDYRTALRVFNEAGVRQQLPFGGEVVASGLVNFVQSLSGGAAESESAEVVLSGSIPLLRGFGMVNLENLISSERGVVYAVRGFEEFRRQFVVRIATEYFELLEAQQNIVNQRTSLRNLSLLTERTYALFEAGRLSFLEVQRSLGSRFQAEAALVDAEEQYQSQLDRFKILVGMPVREQLDIIGVQLDVAVPKASADEAIETALRYRLDFRTASDRIEDARRRVQNASNGLLPELNLTGNAKAGNLEDTPARRIDPRTTQLEAGLTLDLPLDRVQERNTYRAALIAFDQQRRSYVALRDQITASVRDALRTIGGAQVRLEIQRQGIELAQRRLDFANTSLLLGRTEARDVVEAQAELISAQSQFERARSQFQIQVLEYMRVTGTLRVDPDAGAIGRAMDRASPGAQQRGEETIR